MIIKEPYLKYSSLQEGVAIRVDSPSDVIFVDERDEALLASVGALKWRKKETLSFELLHANANQHFLRKEFHEALALYNRALRVQPNASLIQLNRAAVLLQQERFHEAYEAAKAALDGGACREKALYRMGKAAYGMRDWEGAIEHYRMLQREYPQNKDADELLRSALARAVESRSGKYDMRRLYNEAYIEGTRRLDVADFVGPVAVVDIPGKGKGVVASKDIPRGTLLMVSKAFAHTSESDVDSHVIAADMITMRGNTSVQYFNKLRAVQELRHNPRRAKELYALYAGPMSRDDMLPEGVIDVARIEQICSLNSFGTDSRAKKSGNHDEQSELRDAHSLFILPSFMNHSCVANAHRTFYGDVMVVYAVADLKKGDEVTLAYLDWTRPYAEREKTLSHYGFQCHCRLCELDRSDVHYHKRQDLVERVSRLHSRMQSTPKKFIDKALPILEELRQTYTSRKELRLQMLDPLRMLSTAYERLRNIDGCIRCMIEAHECLDDDILRCDYGPGSLYLPLAAHLAPRAARREDYTKYRRLAVDYLRIRGGISAELLEEITAKQSTIP